jgi:hypothetical protein
LDATMPCPFKKNAGLKQRCAQFNGEGYNYPAVA